MIGEKKKPPLSGREGGSRGRKEGEDCVSAASSAAPSEASASERKSPIPGGGSSWFVLLTEEKNEQKIPSWIPHQVGNGRSMTRESVCCHSGAPPGIQSLLQAR